MSSAANILLKQFKELTSNPVPGFTVALRDEDNVFEWDVGIIGAPNTIYEGGYFKATLKFPNDYPFNPPTFKFNNEFFHPNVYIDGRLCISILHPPGDDPTSGETAAERWNPTQSVEIYIDGRLCISILHPPGDDPTSGETAAERWNPTQSVESILISISEEDLQLKNELEMLVERLKEGDVNLHRPALESLRTLIRTSTSSMTSVPKPLKFLRSHYVTITEIYQNWPPGDNKLFLADILSVLAMTYDEGKRESLKYRLQGSREDPGSWGHEYVRHLSTRNRPRICLPYREGA
ncbi:unnamed protein product [Rhizophagus irregularis]|nr:unnamed protein product [Rhizophagus irregularis]